MKGCPDCDKMVLELNETREHLENAERDLRSQRKSNVALRRMIADQRREGPHWADAQRVFDHWVKTLYAHSTGRMIFGEKRQEKVLARLREGWTVEQLCEAIDGCAAMPFERDGVRYDDLELICRNEAKVVQFRKRAQAAIKPSPGLGDISHPIVARLCEYCGEPKWDAEQAALKFRCPACRVLWDRGVRPLLVAQNGTFVLCTSCGATIGNVLWGLGHLAREPERAAA